MNLQNDSSSVKRDLNIPASKNIADTLSDKFLDEVVNLVMDLLPDFIKDGQENIKGDVKMFITTKINLALYSLLDDKDQEALLVYIKDGKEGEARRLLAEKLNGDDRVAGAMEVALGEILDYYASFAV